MKCKPKQITFTVTKTETIEITVSQENGFDMPETLAECIEIDKAIKNTPLDFVYDISGWEVTGVETGNLEYKE